jgi:hypothetical protein
MAIMEDYHEQDKSAYGVDTPIWTRSRDVWQLFSKWEAMLQDTEEIKERRRKKLRKVTRGRHY